MRGTGSLIAAALTALPQVAPAQVGPPSGSTPPAPDVVQACAGCHGARGQGDPPAAPRIAGQSPHYISKQLRSYANGTRRAPVMEAIARSLSPQDMATAAAYFARMDAPVVRGASPPGPPDAAERGRVLAKTGSRERRVQACTNCHGPAGAGQPPTIPYLAGLPASYLIASLEAWRAGTRTNDAGQQMAGIARALAPEDIVAVARNYSRLSPPPPQPLDLAQPPPAPAPLDLAQPAPARGPTAGAARRAEVPAAGGAGGAGEATDGAGGADSAGEATDGAGGVDSPGAAGGAGAAARADDANGADSPRGAADVGSASAIAQTRQARETDVSTADPARGQAILASGIHGCAACHTIPGVRGARGVVGPPLGGFAQRAFIAGQLPNGPSVLEAFLQNPQALVPRTGMPDTHLTPEQARHIAAYLYTLEP